MWLGVCGQASRHFFQQRSDPTMSQVEHSADTSSILSWDYHGWIVVTRCAFYINQKIHLVEWCTGSATKQDGECEGAAAASSFALAENTRCPLSISLSLYLSSIGQGHRAKPRYTGHGTYFRLYYAITGTGTGSVPVGMV